MPINFMVGMTYLFKWYNHVRSQWPYFSFYYLLYLWLTWTMTFCHNSVYINIMMVNSVLHWKWKANWHQLNCNGIYIIYIYIFIIYIHLYNIYIYNHIYITSNHLSIYLSIYLFLYIYIYIYIYLHTYIHTYIYIYIYISCIYTYTYTYTYIHAYIYIYINIYIYNSTRRHLRLLHLHLFWFLQIFYGLTMNRKV